MIYIEREFNLDLSAGQKSLIDLTFDICDDIYNTMLIFMEDFLKTKGKYPTRKDGNGYFNNILLPNHPEWKAADSHAIRGIVNEIVPDYFKCKGVLSPVNFSMYPRCYRTYTASFRYDDVEGTIKIPKLGAVHTNDRHTFIGEVKSIRIVSEEPGIYKALVGDYMKRVVINNQKFANSKTVRS